LGGGWEHRQRQEEVGRGQMTLAEGGWGGL